MLLSRRLCAILLPASLLLSACGQDPDVRREYGDLAQVGRAMPPAGYPTPQQRPPAITFAVWAPDGVPAELAAEARAWEGVEAIGELALGTVTLRAARGVDVGTRELSVVAVSPEPLMFEPAFARVAAVLSAGDAALNVNAFSAMKIRAGSVLRVAGPNQALNMRIGSVVGGGSIFDHELLMPIAPAGLLGVTEMRALLVAVEPDAFTKVSADLVERAGDGARIRSLQEVDAEQGTVLPEADVRRYFGSFPYVRGPGDSIVPDPRWVKAAIIDWKVPILGWVRCHRNMVGQLAWALWDIEQAGLAKKIESYDGCYVPRMQRLDETVLSAHAYGIAIDLNAATNAQGDATPEIDPRIVKIFRKWGFAWGGNFSVPDGMHFEFARFVTPPKRPGN